MKKNTKLKRTDGTKIGLVRIGPSKLLFRL